MPFGTHTLTWPRTPVCIASVMHYIVHSIVVTVTYTNPFCSFNLACIPCCCAALSITRISLTRSCVNHCPTPSNTCVQSSFIPSVSPSLHQFLMLSVTPAMLFYCVARTHMHSITHSITHYVSHSATLTVTPHHPFREQACSWLQSVATPNCGCTTLHVPSR